MTHKTNTASRRRISPALVISCLALFLALAGSALALPKNTVRSAQIVDGTIRTVDIRDQAVNSAKVAEQSLTANDLATDSVGNEELAENAVASPEVAPDSLTTADLGTASVSSSEVTDQSLGSDDLGANSVGSSELQADSVRAAELAGIVQVSNSTEIKGGDNASVSVACPAGTAVISGGGSSGFYQVHLASSYRVGNGWRIDARSGAVGDTTIVVYAYCLSA
jgi:hypothetical protein